MGAWDRISGTIVGEFSDIGDLEEVTRVVLRLLVAALLGGLLGWEREQARQAAGLRTHMLVALGAALFVLVPLQGGMELDDLSRVMQGLVAGIGFLCAGTILKPADSNRVRGLTTAASLWLAAAIGMTAGLGLQMTALLATLLALGILALDGPAQRLFRRTTRRD